MRWRKMTLSESCVSLGDILNTKKCENKLKTNVTKRKQSNKGMQISLSFQGLLDNFGPS